MRDALLGEPGLAPYLVDPPSAPLLAPLAVPPLTARQAGGLDLILEGFLLHHGTPRHLAPPDRGRAVLAGDYCYAQGLVRVAEAGDLALVQALAELIALSAGLVAQGRHDGLPALWQGTLLAIRDPDPALHLRFAAAKLALRDGDDGPLRALVGAAAGLGIVREALAA